MIISNWPNGVNTEFFSYNAKPLENAETTSFLSGRVIAWQRNTKKNKEITCKLMLDVLNELPIFWEWFNDNLGQVANPFRCEALGDKVYRFTSIPEPEDTDTVTQILTLNLEEV